MQVILGIIIFGLIAVAIIVMIVINFMYRNVKRLREDAEDFLYRQGKRREQKERNPFGEDYFKSSRKPGAQGGSKQQGRSRSASSDSEQEKQRTARRTTTSGGVTIIDQREEDKKIFEKGDDEYVEFEEI